jgi:methylated-DNA-[protein]-cysteine S-methyltransferase
MDEVKIEDIRHRVLTATDITAFQRKVYLALLDVPRGTTITYGELAKRIDCKSAQAVGQALRRNPFAPEVPCHRVVAKDGIGGFSGQTEGKLIAKKIELLKSEGATLTNGKQGCSNEDKYGCR